MYRVFKFDAKRNSLIAQLILMILVAFFSFYGYKVTHSLWMFGLIILALGFTFVYVYRIFFIHVIFQNNEITYKSFFKTICFKRQDIQEVFLISLDKKVQVVLTDSVLNLPKEKKIYVVISKNGKLDNDIFKFSIFSLANENRIILEYVPGMEYYLKYNRNV